MEKNWKNWDNGGKKEYREKLKITGKDRKNEKIVCLIGPYL